KQSIKSVYLLCPVELKYSAIRYHNVRPYISTGLIPSVDVNRRRGEIIALKCFDLMASIGLGCDIYMPYFKLNPELKFCFGLTDAIQHNRPDLTDDDTLNLTRSIKRAKTSMIVLTFYFE
ncbi:MAG: PorT family protein, partial [Muribaculaceae bacterium]|nr:PorT family protein [Muribaculaceae bacterium]